MVGKSRQEEDLKAARAAVTAMSTSWVLAVFIFVFSLWSLWESIFFGGGCGVGGCGWLRGVYGGDFLPLLRFDPFIVDEEASWLDVFVAIGGCEFN